MGTRSLTFFYEENQTAPLCGIYRQFDGYMEGHGQELAKLLSKMTVTNGFSGNMKAGKYANGMGCLAAQVIAKLKKNQLGNIYMTSTNLALDQGQEYVYHVTENKGKVNIRCVTHGGALLFDGTAADFLKHIAATK